jgi:maleylpyruvate isomerase
MAQLVVSEMHPLCNLRVLNYLREQLAQDDAGVDVWYRHWMAEGFTALEREIARHSGDGQHCFGSDISLADVCLVPQVYNAVRFGCDMSSYPVVSAVADCLAAQDAFAAARPELQPDAE